MSSVDKDSDLWETPQWLYKELDIEFQFKYDLCCSIENCKSNFVSYIEYPDGPFIIDYLKSRMNSGVGACFMNPPYSNPSPFIEKAWRDSQYCKIVCLLPNTIKTCKYMDFLDENQGLKIFRKWKKGLEIRDLSRRTKFSNPRRAASSPSFGCMIVIMDRREV